MDTAKYCLRRDAVVRQSLSGDSILIAYGQGAERRQLSVDAPLIVAILFLAREPMDEGSIAAAAARIVGLSLEEARRLVAVFVEEHLLVPAASEAAPGPPSAALARWERWGFRDALDFHHATRNLAFEPGDEAGWARQLDAIEKMAADAARGAEEPSPPPYHTFPGRPLIRLPRSRERVSSRAFADVLHERRTCRAFDRRTVPFAAFGEVMEHAFGETGSVDMGILGRHILRTSPSGGARHPIEVYPVIMSVEGVPPGVYHYSVADHGLELLQEGDWGDKVWEVSHRQNGMKNVSVALFFTVRWARHMWKYRYARSYRMILFDTAHLAQTNLLTATAVGLRTFVTPAVQDEEAERLLGIEDPHEESVLYLTGMG